MGNFTRNVTFTGEFDGDNIVATMRRLSRRDMVEITSMIDHDRMDEDGTPCREDNERMLSLAIDKLPGYVEVFTGPLDAEGAAVDVETVCGDSYFFTLAAEMAAFLISASQMREQDAKNSNGPRNTSSEGQGTRAATESAG